MKYLVDTHCFLWWLTDDSRLSAPARSAMQRTDAQVFLSVASLWEIMIKVSIGKLVFPQDARRYLSRHLTKTGIQLLPIQASHTFELASMQQIHRDPFDRMLVAQSLVEAIPIITKDEVIRRYPVKTIW
jgi:PIN domain nuclease of toxin-antitoxin system